MNKDTRPVTFALPVDDDFVKITARSVLHITVKVHVACTVNRVKDDCVRIDNTGK